MADRFSGLDISYDDKRWGNIIDPGEWNQNFHEVEDWVNDLVENLNSGILSPEDMEELEEMFATREFVDALFLAISEHIDEDVVPQLVKKSGDTLTGALTLSGNPTDSLHAATKQYVDNVVSLVLPAPPQNDGSYRLKLLVNQGVPTYTWVQNISFNG